MDSIGEISEAPPHDEGPYMTRASHFMIREEFQARCDALEMRQDEQFEKKESSSRGWRVALMV